MVVAPIARPRKGGPGSTCPEGNGAPMAMGTDEAHTEFRSGGDAEGRGRTP